MRNKRTVVKNGVLPKDKEQNGKSEFSSAAELAWQGKLLVTSLGDEDFDGLLKVDVLTKARNDGLEELTDRLTSCLAKRDAKEAFLWATSPSRSRSEWISLAIHYGSRGDGVDGEDEAEAMLLDYYQGRDDNVPDFLKEAWKEHMHRLYTSSREKVVQSVDDALVFLAEHDGKGNAELHCSRCERLGFQCPAYGEFELYPKGPCPVGLF